jgi:hypothetical protein
VFLISSVTGTVSGNAFNDSLVEYKDKSPARVRQLRCLVFGCWAGHCFDEVNRSTAGAMGEHFGEISERNTSPD